jgi:cellulose synthase/poly-beta-1,6-N-acetylglucosamine synthase-like glycosyltransferase
MIHDLNILHAVFWISFVSLVFAFGGYHFLMGSLVRKQKNRDMPGLSETALWPGVSFLLVAADEESRVESRIANLLQSDYPTDKLELLIVTDGSGDGTVEIVRRLMTSDSRIRLVELAQRQGKANGLNHGIAAARNEIVALVDARQRFDGDTLKLLVRHFFDDCTGAVSGRLVVDGNDSAVGQGISAYWSMEVRLRAAESELDSCIGCTGAVYAIRRDLYRPIPADTLLDDVVIPMQIALLGYRVRYEPCAVAHDPQEIDSEREQIRKRRTLSGNFQMLFRYPGWLLPWRNRLWWQLIAHKYLRLAGPVSLFLVFATSAALLDRTFYMACFLGQICFYTLACVGFLAPRLAGRLTALPAAFVFLNWMTVRGFLHYCIGPRTGAWETVKAK